MKAHLFSAQNVALVTSSGFIQAFARIGAKKGLTVIVEEGSGVDIRIAPGAGHVDILVVDELKAKLNELAEEYLHVEEKPRVIEQAPIALIDWPKEVYVAPPKAEENQPFWRHFLPKRRPPRAIFPTRNMKSYERRGSTMVRKMS